MVSPLSRTDPPRPVAGRHRVIELDRFGSVPRLASVRWLVRLAFSLPYLVVAIATTRGDELRVTPNQELIDRLARIRWDRADVTWVGDIYPPMSTLLAAVIPGGRLGLAIAGALIAGVFLQKMLEIMVHRRFTVTLTTLLLLALAANPLFAYTATENLPAFLGLAFFGLGVGSIVRFVAWGSTQSGFRAGILLMLAVLSDLSGLVYVLTAASAAPFLRLGRHGQPGARAANVLVIVYPTLAALAALVALNLVFLRDPLGAVGDQLVQGIPERFAALGPSLLSPGGALIAAPVLSAWVVALIVRRPGAILVSSLVFAAILAADVLGLVPPSSAGTTFILMTLLAIALIPTPRRRLLIALVDLVAVLQIAIAWTAAVNTPIVVAWMTTLGSSLAP